MVKYEYKLWENVVQENVSERSVVKPWRIKGENWSLYLSRNLRFTYVKYVFIHNM
jgi:hypothetical protein